jgi:hypothetical protein
MAENAAQEQPRRGPGRPFQPGQSGNPNGKPRGLRNRATVLLDAISDGDLTAIVSTVVEKAKAGDLIAARLILDRVAPAPKGRALALDVPAIGEWDGSATVLTAYRRIIEAVRAGDVSPAEGLDFVALIEAQRSAVKELRPAAMHREPTPEELAEQKRGEEELAEFVRLNLG